MIEDDPLVIRDEGVFAVPFNDARSVRAPGLPLHSTASDACRLHDGAASDAKKTDHRLATIFERESADAGTF